MVACPPESFFHQGLVNRQLGACEGRRVILRIRVGDYRVIYSIEDDVLVVTVVRVAHRREAYRS